MNTISKLLILAVFVIIIIPTGCKDDEEQYISSNGYIVGFDPCTISHHYRIGYIIISVDLKDTLLTYNISDEEYKMPASILSNVSDTLYQIPFLYFQNYNNSCFFPDSLRYKYEVKFSYSVAKNDEKVYNLCIGCILVNFYQIIIKQIDHCSIQSDSLMDM